MATTDTSAASVLEAEFPVPLARAESHSWAYGTRCVNRRGTHRETWADEAGRRAIAVFDVTDHTVVLRLRTPAGRQSFYGMADRDYDDARGVLGDAEAWTRQTGRDME